MVPSFSTYLMSSHGIGGSFLAYMDVSKKYVIQAQHEVMRIGTNEGRSGAFVCYFLVDEVKATMQALCTFRGMVQDSSI
jgi:hypothetical protein